MTLKKKVMKQTMSVIIGWIFCFCVALNTRAADMECDNQAGWFGSMVTFTLWVNSAPNEVGSFGLEIHHSPNVLRYEGYSEGSLVIGFQFFSANVSSPGTVKVGGFAAGNGPQIREGASGSVVSLDFEVVGHDDCLIRIGRLKDDIETWSTRPGYFTGDHEYEEEIEPDLDPAEPGPDQEPVTTILTIESQSSGDTSPSTSSLGDEQDPFSDEPVIVVTESIRVRSSKEEGEASTRDQEIAGRENPSLSPERSSKKMSLPVRGHQIVKEGGNEKSPLQKESAKRITPISRNTHAEDEELAAVEKTPGNQAEEKPQGINGHTETATDSAQAQGFPWQVFVEAILVLCAIFLIFMGLRNRKR